MSQTIGRPLVIGTAGHIDHGKTTLVKALTGQDADRLPEERARGITIDLGFAHMTLPSGQRIAFIDVPGHERFVRNMVSGVHGMDAVLWVVAADEGIMPQSTEHLDILELLGVQAGLTVITKAGLVDDDMVSLVSDMVKEATSGTFLENQPIVVVDSVNGQGLSELIGQLEALTTRIGYRRSDGFVKLPIDRVFSVRGFGTVVTGTLVRGTIATDDMLEIVPGGIKARVRGLQVHNQGVAQAASGQRVAVNLGGVDRSQVERGQVLASPTTLSGQAVALASLSALGSCEKIRERTRVHVHCGTAEALARVFFFDREALQAGETAFCELRLESVMPIERGDRYLIRSYSPMRTIGGGQILEVGVHHRKKEPGLLERLQLFSEGDPTALVDDLLQRAEMPHETDWVSHETGVMVLDLPANPAWVAIEGAWWHRSRYQDWLARVEEVVQQYRHSHPIKPGMPQEALKAQLAHDWPLRVFQSALSEGGWVLDREWVRPAVAEPLSDQHKRAIDTLYEAIEAQGLRPQGLIEWQARHLVPAQWFDDIVEYLYLQQMIYRLEDNLVIGKEAYQWGWQTVKTALTEKGALSTSELKDQLGTNRRYAILFLELLDRQRMTRRIGDRREWVG